MTLALRPPLLPLTSGFFVQVLHWARAGPRVFRNVPECVWWPPGARESLVADVNQSGEVGFLSRDPL